MIIDKIENILNAKGKGKPKGYGKAKNYPLPEKIGVLTCGGIVKPATMRKSVKEDVLGHRIRFLVDVEICRIVIIEQWN
mgnify:CR=1 FL=1